MLDRVARKKTTLRRALLRWYRQNARDLPWRRTRDPYKVWLAEILLQQTRVEAALPYYERFVRAFPTVRKLAAADEDRVLKLWEGLGYYSRARNLHRAAKIIADERGGRFPCTAAEWQELPGVGRYTAGAIASIAFGEPAPILDGNVKRVLARIFRVEASIDEPATLRRLWSAAEALVPRKAPGDFNQALMELGARVCRPRKPRCDECPVRRQCEAHARGQERGIPVRRPKKALPHYEVVAAAIEKRGWFLIGKRPADSMLGGLWELPGGKVDPGETHREALTREVREELGIKIRIGPLVASVRHAYSHFEITLHVYRAKQTGGRVGATHYSQAKWVPRAHFGRYAFPTATRKVLHLL